MTTTTTSPTLRTTTTATAAAAPNRRWTLPLAEHPALELMNDTVQLTIVPTVAAEVPYLELLGHDSQRVLVYVQADGGVTRVRIDSGAGPFAWSAGMRVRAVLHVPAAVRGRVRSSAGWLHVEHLDGCALTLETDLGAISLDEVHGSVRASTQAGRIDGEGLRGTFDVSSSAGAIKLEIAALDPGIHRVHTNVGAIKVDLARGMRVHILGRTEIGAARIDFPSSADAAATLDLTADVGAIKVRESFRYAAG